jgi:hypothetical protein
MKIEVPVFNEDGSIKASIYLGQEEAAHILQFAVNFLMSAGLAAHYAIANAEEVEEGDDVVSSSTTLN